MTTQKLSYMQETDAWLTELLQPDVREPSDDFDAVKQAVKDRLLRSFRNGQRMCPKCNPRPPVQKTR